MTENATPATTPQAQVLRMTADIVAAYVGNNPVPAAQLPELIRTIHASLTGLEAPPPPAPGDLVPAVPIRKSVFGPHRLPGGRQAAEDPQAEPAHGLWPDAGAVPRQVGPVSGVPDGRPELCGAALRLRQAHRPWPQARRAPRPPSEEGLSRGRSRPPRKGKPRRDLSRRGFASFALGAVRVRNRGPGSPYIRRCPRCRTRTWRWRRRPCGRTGGRRSRSRTCCRGSPPTAC